MNPHLPWIILKTAEHSFLSEYFSDDVELGSLLDGVCSIVLDVKLFCGAENKLPILEVQESDKDTCVGLALEMLG